MLYHMVRQSISRFMTTVSLTLNHPLLLMNLILKLKATHLILTVMTRKREWRSNNGSQNYNKNVNRTHFCSFSRDSDLLRRGGGRRERAREEDEELRLRHSHELDGAGREAEASEESSEQNGLSQGFRAKVRRRRKNADESPAKAMQLNELQELFFCDEPASKWEAACRVFLADSQSSKNLVAGEMHHLYNLAANLKLDETVAEPEKCAPCDFGIIEYC